MPRVSDRQAACALFLIAFSIVGAFVAMGIQMTADDGFYYLVIARNVASGGGSTFDGLHPTNGYHPLWLLLLVPLAAAWPERLAEAATLLQGVLWGAAGALVYLVARRAGHERGVLRRRGMGRLASALAAIAFWGFTVRQAACGVEFSLQALGIAAAALAWTHLADAPDRRRACLHLGALAALAFLARLETAALAGLLGLALFAELRGDPMRRRCLAAFAAPLALAAIAWGVLELFLFGHLLPVSAAVKGAWSAQLLAADATAAGGVLAAKLQHLREILGEVLRRRPELLAGLLASLVARPGRLAKVLGARSPFVLYAAVQLAACALLYHDGLSLVPWYFVVQPLLTALWIGAALEAGTGALRTRLPRAATVVAAAALLLVLGWTLRRGWGERARLAPERLPLRNAALWCRAHLPADAVIGSWNAGTLGYLSGRRVIDLDGVVNSWEYFERERFDLCAYWQRNGVTHVVDVFDGGQASSVVPTLPAYAPCAGRLVPIGVAPGDPRNGRAVIHQLR